MPHIHSLFILNDDINSTLSRNPANADGPWGKREIFSRIDKDNTSLLTFKDGTVVAIYGTGDKKATLDISEINLGKIANIFPKYTFDSNTQIAFYAHGAKSDEGCKWTLLNSEQKKNFDVGYVLKEIADTAASSNWTVTEGEGLSLHVFSCYGGTSNLSNIRSFPKGTSVMLHAGDVSVLNTRVEHDITKLLETKFTDLNSRTELFAKTIGNACGPISMYSHNGEVRKYDSPPLDALKSDASFKQHVTEVNGKDPINSSEALQHLLQSNEITIRNTAELDLVIKLINNMKDPALEAVYKTNEKTTKEVLDAHTERLQQLTKLKGQTVVDENGKDVDVDSEIRKTGEDKAKQEKLWEKFKEDYSQKSLKLINLYKQQSLESILSNCIDSGSVSEANLEILNKCKTSYNFSSDNFLEALDKVSEMTRPEVYAKSAHALFKLMHVLINEKILPSLNLPRFSEKFKNPDNQCKNFSKATIDALRQSAGVGNKVDGTFKEKAIELLKTLGINDFSGLDKPWTQGEQEVADFVSTMTNDSLMKKSEYFKQKAETITYDKVKELCDERALYSNIKELPDLSNKLLFFYLRAKLDIPTDSNIKAEELIEISKVIEAFVEHNPGKNSIDDEIVESFVNALLRIAINSSIRTEEYDETVSKADKKSPIMHATAKIFSVMIQHKLISVQNVDKFFEPQADISYKFFEDIKNLLKDPKKINTTKEIESGKLPEAKPKITEPKPLDTAAATKKQPAEPTHHDHDHAHSNLTVPVTIQEQINQLIEQKDSTGKLQKLLHYKYTKATNGLKKACKAPSNLTQEQARAELNREDDYGSICVYEEFNKIAKLFEELNYARMDEEFFGLIDYFVNKKQRALLDKLAEFSISPGSHTDVGDSRSKAFTLEDVENTPCTEKFTPQQKNQLLEQFIDVRKHIKYINMNSNCYGMFITSLFPNDDNIRKDYNKKITLTDKTTFTVGSGDFIAQQRVGNYTQEEVIAYAHNVRNFFKIMISKYRDATPEQKESIEQLLNKLLRKEDYVKLNFLTTMKELGGKDNSKAALELAKKVLTLKGFGFDDEVAAPTQSEEAHAAPKPEKQKTEEEKKVHIISLTGEELENMATQDKTIVKTIEKLDEKTGENMVHDAIKRGMDDVVEDYKKIGVNINLPTADGRTAESLVSKENQDLFAGIFGYPNPNSEVLLFEGLKARVNEAIQSIADSNGEDLILAIKAEDAQTKIASDIREIITGFIRAKAQMQGLVDEALEILKGYKDDKITESCKALSKLTAKCEIATKSWQKPLEITLDGFYTSDFEIPEDYINSKLAGIDDYTITKCNFSSIVRDLLTKLTHAHDNVKEACYKETVAKLDTSDITALIDNFNDNPDFLTNSIKAEEFPTNVDFSEIIGDIELHQSYAA
jgi:protein-tyrosine-phosphatase